MRKKRINSRAKGCAGEREFAEFLRSRGVAARRGQQFCGAADSPDIVHSVANIHFEVKRTERSSPYEWLLQAAADCDAKVPVIAHRQSHRDWIAILPMDDLLALIVKANAA